MSFVPFSEFDRRAASLVRAGSRSIPVDLLRDGDRYLLTADLPGIEPGSVDIDVDGRVLSIRAQRTATPGENTKWLVQERRSGSYLRQFTLGEGVNVDGITASYDAGVLSVVIPVIEKAKPRKIAVASASDASETTESAESAESAPLAA